MKQAEFVTTRYPLPGGVDLNLSDELIAGLPTRLDNPFLSPSLLFVVTTQCNLACKYCYNHCEANESLDPALAVKFLDSLLKYQRDMGVDLNGNYRVLAFSGGEPSLNPAPIFRVIDYVVENDVFIVPSLTTNGIMSDAALDRFIADRFYFTISFDGTNTSNRVAKDGLDVHERVLKTIKKIKEHDLSINLAVTITEENVHQMADLVVFASAHRLERVIFLPLLHYGRASDIKKIKRPSIDSYVMSYLKALDCAAKLGVKIVNCEEEWLASQGESVMIPRITLLPDGSLIMMATYSSAKSPEAAPAIIGRCTLENGIEVYPEKIERLVMNFIKNRAKHCVDCEWWTCCRGRNKNLIHFMEDRKPDNYYCELTKRLIQAYKK